MQLISSTLLLQHAKENGYCIGAFNVYTFDMLQAVVDAAIEMDSPIIIQTSVGSAKQLGLDHIVRYTQTASSISNIPISLHLDHCSDIDLISATIQAGYTSVMIDASHLPFEENVKQTQRVVELAKASNIHVEAELGKIGGVEDDIILDDSEATLANPQECQTFVTLTGINSLAPAIGTAHGIYRNGPKIDFSRIESIAELVSVPLVLHGGSGIPSDQVRKAISLGMCKMNIATELRIAFTNGIKNVFQQNPAESDPRIYMVEAIESLKKMVIDKILLCGSKGKALYFR